MFDVSAPKRTISSPKAVRQPGSQAISQSIVMSTRRRTNRCFAPNSSSPSVHPLRVYVHMSRLAAETAAAVTAAAVTVVVVVVVVVLPVKVNQCSTPPNIRYIPQQPANQPSRPLDTLLIPADLSRPLSRSRLLHAFLLTQPPDTIHQPHTHQIPERAVLGASHALPFPPVADPDADPDADPAHPSICT